MTERAKWRLLGALALVWLIAIVVRVASEPEPQRVPLKFRSGETVAAESTRSDGGEPGLVRPKLARGSQAPFKTPKNIFAPAEHSGEPGRAHAPRLRKNPETPVPAPLSAPPPPPAVAFTAPPSPSPEQLAAQQARQWLGQYRFFGYLGQGGDQRAFLSKGHDIFIVRVGDSIEGRIMVTAIDASSVKLRETGTSLETTLSLTKDSGSAFQRD
ncbi:MAG: hypothetical protein ACREIO_00805 [Nitrospiraceae bacterium]